MSSNQVFHGVHEFDLSKAFGVRLPVEDHRALLTIAQNRKIRRNRLIQEAVAQFLAQSQNVEPPAA